VPDSETGPQRSGADIVLEHITGHTDAKALIVVDGNGDETVAELPPPVECSCGPKRRGTGRDPDCPVHGDQRRGGL